MHVKPLDTAVFWTSWDIMFPIFLQNMLSLECFRLKSSFLFNILLLQLNHHFPMLYSLLWCWQSLGSYSSHTGLPTVYSTWQVSSCLRVFVSSTLSWVVFCIYLLGNWHHLFLDPGMHGSQSSTVRLLSGGGLREFYTWSTHRWYNNCPFSC